MDSSLAALVIVGQDVALTTALFFLLLFICVGFIGLFLHWFWILLRRPQQELTIERVAENPILEPLPGHWWESEAVFNPAAVVHGGRVHLFYRALGRDGISRFGYASSSDGVHFERLPYPVFAPENAAEARAHWPNTSPARLTYDTTAYASGGGWGGCEDPRAVLLDGRVYLTFNMFNGWNSMRVGYTSIADEHLVDGKWLWEQFRYLSRPGERQKNWVLFPEKINGKFALFHNLDRGDPGRVHIAYLNELDMKETPTPEEAPDPQKLPDHIVAWHKRTRSAAAPPIKTPYGWLLLYHAMDKDDPDRYKLGAMILDHDDPTRVVYRAQAPILAPDAWYENDWKPGILYASGAVVFGNDLFVYYGAGDKHIAAARMNLDEFLEKLTTHEEIALRPAHHSA